MGSFKSAFDPLDLEIIDRVYEVAWAHVQARHPNRDTVSDGERQEVLRKKIFGVARMLGSGQHRLRHASRVSARDDTRALDA